MVRSQKERNQRPAPSLATAPLLFLKKMVEGFPRSFPQIFHGVFHAEKRRPPIAET